VSEARLKILAFLGRLSIALLLALGWLDLDDLKDVHRPVGPGAATPAGDQPGRRSAAYGAFTRGGAEPSYRIEMPELLHVWLAARACR
jgi:hypothetical protein